MTVKTDAWMTGLVASIACVCWLLDTADAKLSAYPPLCGGLCQLVFSCLHNSVYIIISIRCSKIFANYGCHYGFENRITFSQGREVFNGRGRFCLYAVSGIINKANQQNIIRRLKLVPRINVYNKIIFDLNFAFACIYNRVFHLFSTEVMLCSP